MRGEIPGYLAVLILALLILMVVLRIRQLKRQGIEAMHFGKLDKTDFLIPPFILFYFYLIIAHAFHLPGLAQTTLFHSPLVPWLGVGFFLIGLVLLVWSLVSFGTSFRVGIDTDHPDKLITNGIFAYTRNPIYLSFWLVLLGQFLVFSNWIPLVYLAAASWLFNRQVLREEAFLREHYGRQFADFSKRVRRYL